MARTTRLVLSPVAEAALVRDSEGSMNISLAGSGSESVLSALESAGISYSVWLPGPGEDGQVWIRIGGRTPVPIVAGVLMAWIRARSNRCLSLRVKGNTIFVSSRESVRETAFLLAQGTNIKVLEKEMSVRKPRASSECPKLVDGPVPRVFEKRFVLTRGSLR